jgi:hypothetical protein
MALLINVYIVHFHILPPLMYVKYSIIESHQYTSNEVYTPCNEIIIFFSWITIK